MGLASPQRNYNGWNWPYNFLNTRDNCLRGVAKDMCWDKVKVRCIWESPLIIILIICCQICWNASPLHAFAFDLKFSEATNFCLHDGYASLISALSLYELHHPPKSRYTYLRAQPLRKLQGSNVNNHYSSQSNGTKADVSDGFILFSVYLESYWPW